MRFNQPVDVTAKQEQARAAADADFEASYKAPEKRKEKELVEDATVEADADTAVDAANIENAVSDAKKEASEAIDKEADNTDSSPDPEAPIKAAEGKEAKEVKVNQQKNEDLIAKADLADETNKGVRADNSTVKVKTESATNVSGRAPKTKSGSLDPNRLPGSNDSSSDSTDTENKEG